MNQQMLFAPPPNPNGQEASATHRWRLWRTIDPQKLRSIMWVMLNPSTADAVDDDPTTRKVRHYSTREGFGRFEIVNLCAYRSRDPAAMFALFKRFPDEAVGHLNTEHLRGAAARADAIVYAWGALVTRELAQHAREVRALIAKLRPDVAPLCLGYTRGTGDPRHPLMMRNDTPLERYEEQPHPLQETR